MGCDELDLFLWKGMFGAVDVGGGNRYCVRTVNKIEEKIKKAVGLLLLTLWTNAYSRQLCTDVQEMTGVMYNTLTWARKKYAF